MLALAVAPRLAHADDAPSPAPATSAQVAPTVAQPPAPPAPAPAAAPSRAEPELAPSVASAPPPPPVMGTYVELHASDGRAVIERRVGTSSYSGLPLAESGLLSVGHWQHACVAPCRLRLDPRYTYRVAGDGLVASDSFALPEGKDRVRVDAQMGSSTGRVVGILLTGAGALGIAAGGAALAVSPILASEEVGSQGFRTGVLAGGIGVLGAGLLTAGVGLYLWITNGSSAHPEGQAQASASPPRRAAVGLSPSGITF